MPDLEAMYRNAHEQLNSAYVAYTKSKPTSLAHEFDSIKLQACIFQYEMCVELVAFVSNNPVEFARKVSLKGVIQKLFEYNILINHLMPRVTALADERGVQVSDVEFKTEKKNFRNQFKTIESWSTVRNKAIGHYDKDTSVQVELLTTIDPEIVMDVCVAFLSCNMAFLRMLQMVGRQK